MLKKNIFITTASLLMVFACSPKDDDVTPPEIKENTSPTTSEVKISDSTIKAYFLESLSNETQADFQQEEDFFVNEITTKRTSVWSAWKDANNASNEEKLIGLKDLNTNPQGSWTLPANLEPNAVMPYYFGSKGTIPTEGYPLFLFLHGRAPDANQQWNVMLYWAKQFKDSPSAYFIPKVPNATGQYYDWRMKSKLFAWEKLLRQAFLSENINANKIYFSGISLGGYDSQPLASFYADYLAGAGPMASGASIPSAPAENCRHIAFSLVTGENDTNANNEWRAEYTLATKKEFERLKGIYGDFNHRIELQAGRDHLMDYTTTTPWLINYTRKTNPKTVLWEDFSIDGQRRKGFYNIVIKNRELPKGRTRYKMDINGNNITVNVDLTGYSPTRQEYGHTFEYEKTHIPATKGKFILYLSEKLVNLNEDVTLTVNNKQVFKGKLTLSTKHLINSCKTFFDPERLYPAAIEVDLAQ